jgi:hypothetical protein
VSARGERLLALGFFVAVTPGTRSNAGDAVGELVLAWLRAVAA